MQLIVRGITIFYVLLGLSLFVIGIAAWPRQEYETSQFFGAFVIESSLEIAGSMACFTVAYALWKAKWWGRLAAIGLNVAGVFIAALALLSVRTEKTIGSDLGTTVSMFYIVAIILFVFITIVILLSPNVAHKVSKE